MGGLIYISLRLVPCPSWIRDCTRRGQSPAPVSSPNSSSSSLPKDTNLLGPSVQKNNPAHLCPLHYNSCFHLNNSAPQNFTLPTPSLSRSEIQLQRLWGSSRQHCSLHFSTDNSQITIISCTGLKTIPPPHTPLHPKGFSSNSFMSLITIS